MGDDWFLREGCYRLYWLYVTAEQELQRRYVGSYVIAGKVFLMLDGAELLRLPPHGSPLDEAGAHRLRVLARSTMHVEVERVEENGGNSPRPIGVV